MGTFEIDVRAARHAVDAVGTAFHNLRPGVIRLPCNLNKEKGMDPKKLDDMGEFIPQVSIPSETFRDPVVLGGPIRPFARRADPDDPVLEGLSDVIYSTIRDALEEKIVEIRKRADTYELYVRRALAMATHLICEDGAPDRRPNDAATGRSILAAMGLPTDPVEARKIVDGRLVSR